MFTINAKNRDLSLKIGALRKRGEIPAVFYGAGKATSIVINNREFKKIWHQAGESSIVQISLSPKDNTDSLIHEVQVDPVTGDPIHVDFLIVKADKKIKIKIPIEFIGISGAVKSNLGMLVKALQEVEIEALPKDLPSNVVVDISKLGAVGEHIIVSDLVLPSSVLVITKGTEVVASIIQHKEEKVTEPVDLSKIEVEKKGKKEEDKAEAEPKK
ncbi:MAG: 50S ribosomal protein L25 [Patescibacteria group bacterium]